MPGIHSSITELIGGTPLVRVPHFLAANGAEDANIALKLEYFNPAGSVKDRIALAMITDAEEKGLLKPGGTIIEPSSGNTGIGLAAVGTARGYRVKVVLPASLSVERRALIQAYGGEVILTPGPLAIKGSIAYAEQLHEADPDSVLLGQFDNRPTRPSTTAPPARRSGPTPTARSTSSSPASAPAAPSRAPGATSRSRTRTSG